ncbi:flagellar biosynthesis protein FlhA [Zooshikella ganghwensis]|uniref:Flagellar type III secretion system protein FlhA n=1 Tax=Zooshikella ganghwensis TaxID=202772 RepID=A0A4P9VVR3_9GAMM|nr:flagellar biosynthesis protein FlhA [Zooshikella ganghwensis]RDH46462.1 flagellar type III secretion system protein FlhA [Zooshikella ganghwensis]
MKSITIKDLLGSQSELLLVVAVVGILLVLFTPVPAVVLDILLITNFSFALLILLVTFYIDRPVDFSTFPSLLLIATLFRLALNISATRLILSDGDAGQVINAVGEYVVGGNYIIGLVIFFILIVVQYVVVTNGAQRVAEVAARFTLDSLPGKQMSIDAELNMGILNEQEARKKRSDLEREANFYGAMDGASKFVKGDAIAGIIIVLIDIIGGLSVGIGQNGLSWSTALHTYTLMTVGDGLVTQIPALILSTGTGIIVTRAASDSFLGQEVSRQVTRYPKSLILVAVALLCIMFTKGIPWLPVFAVLLVVSLLTYKAIMAHRRADIEEDTSQQDLQESEGESLYNQLTISPIELSLGKDLANRFGEENSLLSEKIKSFRKQYALESGLVIPKVKMIADSKLADNHYEIRIHGSRVDSSNCYLDRYLAISTQSDIALEGIKDKDPSYQLPAVWITQDQTSIAKQQMCTVVDATTVVFTHFCEVIRRHADELLTRSEVEKLLIPIKQHHTSLYEEVIPNMLTLTDIQKVLQRLVKESVSIRNIEHILEALADHGKTTKDPVFLSESVRQNMGRSICEMLLDDSNTLHVMSLSPKLEQQLVSQLQPATDQTTNIHLDPLLTERLVITIANTAEQMAMNNLKPVLLCSAALRPHLKLVTERTLKHLTILSIQEIPPVIAITSFSTVDIQESKRAN